MLSLVIFLFLFPYIVTVFFQGTPVAGESVYETATETAVMAQGSMPKEREQLIAILCRKRDPCRQRARGNPCAGSDRARES